MCGGELLIVTEQRIFKLHTCVLLYSRIFLIFTWMSILMSKKICMSIFLSYQLIHPI